MKVEIRNPDPDETPLSDSEKYVAIRAGFHAHGQSPRAFIAIKSVAQNHAQRSTIHGGGR